MKKKLFLTDLDGTLLNSQKEISGQTRQLLERVLDEGHYVSISTGRALASAKIQAARLGLNGENCFIISFNGGQIYDITNRKIIFSRTIPMPLIRRCFDAANKAGILLQTYSEDLVLAERDDPDLHEYCQIQYLDHQIVDDVTAALPSDPVKMLALSIHKPERTLAFMHELQPLVGDELDLFHSQPGYLEIVPKNISKGHAVHELCRYIGIDVADCVAAGDADNDIDMIREAGVGAAMINGTPGARAAADFITSRDSDHDGINEVIERFVLQS